MTNLLVAVVKDRRTHRLGLVFAALVGLGMLLAWQRGVGLADLRAAWSGLQGVLGEHPWWLLAALVVLPGLPVPSSALLLLAGAVWGERPLVACGICLVTTLLNQTWTYWVAAGPARMMVQRWIRAGVVRIPVAGRGNDLRLLLVMRLTPGMPLFVQNYVLGFLHVPFRLYAPVSLACTGLFVIGIVLAGAGVSTGSLMPVMSGAGVLVVAAVLVQVVRARLARSREQTTITNGEDVRSHAPDIEDHG